MTLTFCSNSQCTVIMQAHCTDKLPASDPKAKYAFRRKDRARYATLVQVLPGQVKSDAPELRRAITSHMLCRCQPLLLHTPISSPASGSDIRLWKPRCSAIRAQRRKIATAARAQGKVDAYTAAQPYVEAQPTPRQPCSTSGVPTALDIHHVTTLPAAVSAFFLQVLNHRGTVTVTVTVSSRRVAVKWLHKWWGPKLQSITNSHWCRWTLARQGWHCSKPSAKEHIHTRLTGAG